MKLPIRVAPVARSPGVLGRPVRYLMLALIIVASGNASAQDMMGKTARAPAASATLVDATGRMHMPSNYRNTYQYLGSWAVAAEGKGSSQLHVVYASPGAAAAYRATGHFADGAVLV